jgi:hypothetical protein
VELLALCVAEPVGDDAAEDELPDWAKLVPLAPVMLFTIESALCIAAPLELLADASE